MIDGKTWETLPSVLAANGYSRLEYRSFIGFSCEQLIAREDILQRRLTAEAEIRAKEAGKFNHHINIDVVSNLSDSQVAKMKILKVLFFRIGLNFVHPQD
jgi:hypothetical protein